MFKLKLPIRGDDGEEGGGRSPILSEDAQEVESHNSSQSLYDFDEDASSDAAEAGEEEDEDAEEIDLETMEAVFDNDTRQIIIEYEQELNLQDEEWLLANSHADPELIASELTDREVKKQKKLYNLRRQKFYELGGRKKTRNIMMRYGITHLKLLKEQHTDGAGGDYSAVETHPRSVSNSILLHLKYGIDLVRIEWLKIVFRMLAKKQKSEAIDAKRYDVLPALVAAAPLSKSIPSSSAVTGGSSSPQLFKQRNSNGGGGGDSEASPLQPAITRSSSLSWMDADTAGFSLRIPDETPEGATPTNAAVVAAASPTVTAVSDDDPNKAYMQRRKAAGASSNNNNSNAVASSSNDNNNHHNSNNDPPKRIPSNGVDESNFAQGMLCFFELLARHDRRRRLVERELRRLQRQAAANSSGDASGVAAAASADVAAAAMEEAAESAKAELFSTLATAFDPAANFELPPDDTSDLDKSVVMSRAASFVLGNSSTASIAAFAASRRSSMVHAPPAGKTAAQSAPATQDEDEDGDEASPNGGGGGGGGPDDDGRKKFVGRDFLARSNDIIDAGFRFLFCAVDANDNGFITWDALLEYLLDATLLAKAADQTLTSRDYEFVRHHHTSAFTELNDVCLVPARSMFVIGGVHATIIGNKTTSSSTAQQQAGEEAERDNNQAGKKVATLFPERNVIQTPIDPLTFVPQYKVTALCHMASLKMLAIVGSDSTVRIYTLHSVAHPRMIASARFDSNSRTILWFKDLLFIGTRLGTLYSFRMSHSKTGGWQLRPHKQCHSHSGEEGISRIIAIPMESCVCTASYDRSMVLHDAKSLTIVHRFSKEHAQGISDMCYCSCINGLATVSFDHKIMVWMVSLLHNKPILLTDSVRDHVGTLISVSCVEHSQSLVTLDTKGMVKIWGLRNFLCIQTISAASFVPVQDVGAHFFKVVVYHSPPSVVLPLGSTQLHLFSRRRLFVFEYNLSQRNVVLRNTADDEPVVYVGYNYIEQLYITFSINSVRIWEAATCAIRDTFRCTTVEEHGGISSAYLHPNGRAYYVGTHRGSIFAKNFSTGTTMFVARCHRGPSLSLRFCYAATVAARVTATTTTASATTKAGLGDIIVSIADDSCFVLSSDFRTKLTLDGADNPRCLDHDSQSSLILVGDATGVINVYMQANISNQKNLPFQVLQLPVKLPREITALTMFHGLSTFAAVDDEGTMGLFSLKHHPRPFTCVGVWSHVSETSAGGCPSVNAMAFHHSKWLLYCGDELGVVTVYNVRDAFLQSQQTHQQQQQAAAAAAMLMSTSDNATFILDGSMLLGGDMMSPKSSTRAAAAARRAAASGKSPRTFAKSPRLGAKSPRMAGTPRTPNSQAGSPTFVTPGNLMSPTSPRKVFGQSRGGPQFSSSLVDGNAPPPPSQEPLDFRSIGAAVVVVNRFSAHHDGITHLMVISPDNSNMGEGALSLDDPVVGHTVLLTTSADQCCCSWKLSGTVHLGSLEQYGRCRVPITSATNADDTNVIAMQREMHQLDARRDFIKLRSRGLVRLANTRIISIIPQRMLPLPVIQVGQQQQPQQNGLLLSARSNSGGFGASTSQSVTPRSARLSRLMAQIAPTANANNCERLLIHPDVPLRALWTVQEYHRLSLKRKKSVKQLNESNAAGTLAITKAQIETLGSGATMSKPPQDADTLSQMLASEDGANSVLDDLFSLHSGSLHNQPALSRHASSLGGSVKSRGGAAASSTAPSVSISQKFKNLTNALLHDIAPSAQLINATRATSFLGRRVARQQEAQASSKPLVATTESLAQQAEDRRVHSTAQTRAATAKLRRSSSVVSDWGEHAQMTVTDSVSNSSIATTALLSTQQGRRSTAPFTGSSSILKQRDGDREDCNSLLSGSNGSHTFLMPPNHNAGGGRPMSASSSSTSVSRRPVKVVSMYVVPTKTLRQEPAGTKDKRLGYHNGTLEAYRVQQQVNPMSTSQRSQRSASTTVVPTNDELMQQQQEQQQLMVSSALSVASDMLGKSMSPTTAVAESPTSGGDTIPVLTTNSPTSLLLDSDEEGGKSSQPQHRRRTVSEQARSSLLLHRNSSSSVSHNQHPTNQSEMSRHGGLSPVSNDSVWSSPITPEARALSLGAMKNSPDDSDGDSDGVSKDLDRALALLDEAGMLLPPRAVIPGVHLAGNNDDNLAIQQHPQPPGEREIQQQNTSSSSSWTREGLMLLLPDTPFREKLIRTLLDYGQCVRRDLIVEAMTKRKKLHDAMYKHMIFTNKQIKDIANDSLALFDVPLPEDEDHFVSQPKRGSKKSPSPNHLASQQSSTADVSSQQFAASSKSALAYRTTMLPPPPEIFNMRRPRSSQATSTSERFAPGGTSLRPATASSSITAGKQASTPHQCGIPETTQLISQIATITTSIGRGSAPSLLAQSSPTAGYLMSPSTHYHIPTSTKATKDVAEWHVDVPAPRMSLTAALQQRSAMVSGMVRTSLGESFALPSRPGSAAAMLLCDQERRSLHRAMETIALVDKREAVNCAANVLMPTLKPSKMKRASSAAAGRVELQRK